MYPGAYSWTNSYPMHYAPTDDPRAKEFPFHMKMDHQPWPCSGGSYSYPVPHEYHGCCNHSHFGGFRPPYPHYPPPPPTMHTPGFHPSFQLAYPTYSIPPPHYSIEQPRYDYDKNDHHCCGCNHQEKEKKSLRMEREEPKVDKKINESLVPLFLKDSNYPIMWVPPHGNMNTDSRAKENEKKSRMEREEQEVGKKTRESLVPLFLKDSPYPNMWVPPHDNMNTETKAKENKKKWRMEREEPEAVKKTSESLVPLFLKDSPYPIMWVPPHGDLNEESKAKKSEKKTRMDREEPKVEKKTNESLVPLFLKDSPYPIMWVPPHGNVNEESKENEKPMIEREEPKVEKKTNESLVPLFLKDSPYPIMWVPPARYMNEESKVKDKEKRSQDPGSSKDVEPIERGENDEGNRLPFPIFLLPSKNKEVGNETKDNNLDRVAQNRLPDENKKQGSDTGAESETRNKHVVQKVIPVKQVGANEEKKSVEKNVKSDSVERKDNRTEEGKASPKSSKLPPVCLRIDPLPSKKKSSRSPSPPAVKERSESSQQQTQLTESSKKEEVQSKDNIKTVVMTSDANKVEDNSFGDLCENVPKGENRNVKKKKNLSEQEAALMIQSAYRGFEVRKSQPLTKLRKLVEVTKLVADLRNRIQDMESSSSTIRIDDKQKMIVGETIMSLLLKLDTIQGLHPIVRDVRKSVAKELVGLQEKLDSLTSIKSGTPIEEAVSSDKQVMHLEDDAIEEKFDQSNNNDTRVESGSEFSGNHGEDAEGSHNDSGEEANKTNIEPKLELRKVKSTGDLNNEHLVDDVIQQKFDQALTQSYIPNEAIDSVGNVGVEVLDIKPEQQVEHNTGELNNNQIQMSVETEHPADHFNQEKSDHVLAESDSTNEDVGLDTVVFGNHNEVPAIDSVECNVEVALGTKTEQPIEQITGGELYSEKHRMLVETEQPSDNSIQEKSDEVQAESGTIVESMETEQPSDLCEHPIVESYNDGAVEAGGSSFEPPQVETESQQNVIEPATSLEILESEQIVKQEKPVQVEAQFESDIENVDSAEDSNMEDTESQDVSEVEKNDELSKEDSMKGVQEDLIVPTEEAPKSDDVDTGETPPASPIDSHVTSDGDGKLMKELEGVPSVPSMNGGDRKLMEENEKLRLAVEELLKAGNDQLGVIRELSEKVKDLEKKLTKKNKKIKVNKGRSRGFAVQDELSDCLV